MTALQIILNRMFKKITIFLSFLIYKMGIVIHTSEGLGKDKVRK